MDTLSTLLLIYFTGSGVSLLLLIYVIAYDYRKRRKFDKSFGTWIILLFIIVSSWWGFINCIRALRS